VVLGERLDLAAADAVDAAVADVADVEAALAEVHGVDGAAHALLGAVGRGGLEDVGVGELDRHGHALALDLEVGQLHRPGVGAGAGGVAVVLVDGLDGDAAGDLTAGVATHAVGDDREGHLLGDQHVVLVLGPDAADVRLAGETDTVRTDHEADAHALRP
jgi:hypothetical protein